MPQDAKPKPKVFLSYASANQDRVGVLANSMEAEGVEVWWDHAINPGEDYRHRIESALRGCDAAVVCWTRDAAVSDWVASEADDARRRGILIPVLLQACAIPKPFDRLHTANMSSWNGNRADPGFQALVETVRAKAEGRPPRRSAWRKRLFTVGGVGVLGAGALTAALNFGALRYLYDSVVNPAATQKQVAAIEAKIEAQDVLIEAMVKQFVADARSRGEEPDTTSIEAFRKAVKELLASGDQRRIEAVTRYSAGETTQALDDLQALAQEQESLASAQKSSAAEVWKQIGALAFAGEVNRAIAAYERTLELAPSDVDARNELGRLYKRAGRLDEAQAAFQRVLETADASKEEDWQVAALTNLATVAMARSDHAAAESLSKRALAIEGKLGRPAIRAANLGNLGAIARARGDFGAAADFFNRSLAIFEETGDLAGKSIQLGNLGLVAMTLGDLDRAEDFYSRSLAIEKDLGRLEWQAHDLGGLGAVATTRGDLESAEGFLKQALVLSEKGGRRETQAIQLGNLGMVAGLRGDAKAADAYHRRALAIAEEIGHRELEAEQLKNLGMTAMDLEDLDSSEDFLKRALALNKKIGRRQGEAATLGSLGFLAMGRHQLAVAEDYFQRALAMDEQLGVLEGQASHLSGLGLIADWRDQPKIAEGYWRRALALYRRIGKRAGAQTMEEMIKSVGGDPDKPSP